MERLKGAGHEAVVRGQEAATKCLQLLLVGLAIHAGLVGVREKEGMRVRGVTVRVVIVLFAAHTHNPGQGKERKASNQVTRTRHARLRLEEIHQKRIIANTRHIIRKCSVLLACC